MSTAAVPVFAKRLKEARKRAGMTQEQVAVNAGIDEFSASARMSQYEASMHVPRYETARSLAKALRVPVEYLYASDDRTAELLLLWSMLPVAQKVEVLEDLRARTDS